MLIIVDCRNLWVHLETISGRALIYVGCPPGGVSVVVGLSNR